MYNFIHHEWYKTKRKKEKQNNMNRIEKKLDYD